jgi:cell division protein FtsB
VKFIPEIIGCIQVMNKENEELKQRVNQLEEQVKKLLSQFS